MREGDGTREGQYDERVDEKVQRTKTTMMETTMTETTMTMKMVTMTTTMNDDNNDINRRRQFNNQLA